jgi:twinkle protein
MSKIIGDAPCPDCRSRGRDASGNHLMLFEDKGAYCNRCGHTETVFSGEVNERIMKTPEEIQGELDAISEYPLWDTEYRGITPETYQRFGVRKGLSERDGKTPIEQLYPYGADGKLASYNIRILDPKGFYGRGNRVQSEPFGIGLARRNSTKQRIIICEDELSAMSVDQVLSKFTKNAEWKPAVIALTFSPQGIIQDLGRPSIRDFLLSFKEVIFALDNDEAGRDGYQQILKLLPNAMTVELPLKDPNDMLKADMEKELFNAVAFQAKVKGPEGSLKLSDLKERMLTPIERGLDYPWEEMTRCTLGFKTKQVISIASGVGLGKTLIANTIAAWFKKVHNLNSGMIMLEQPAEETGRAIVGAMMEVQINDPSIGFDPEALSQAIDAVDDGFMIFDLIANTEWDNVKRIIRHWVLKDNIKLIFLDNLTTLTAHLDPTSINSMIGKIMSELATMVQELDFTCFVFSHLNPPKTGDSHEDGGEVKEVQLTGSRSAMRYSHFVIGFERNRNPTLPAEEQNLSRLRIMKTRPIGARPGLVGLFYNMGTGLLYQRPETYLGGAGTIMGGEQDE